MKQKNYFFIHKFLLIIGVFLLVSFSLFTSCFAVDVNVNDKKVTMGSFYDDKYYIVFLRGSYYGCVVGNSTFTLSSTDNNGYLVSSDFDNFWWGDNMTHSTDIYTLSSYEPYYSTASKGDSPLYNFNPSYIVFSNFDVYLDNNLVFQGAPQEVPQVELMKATQVEEIPQQIAGILAIVLPIFLAIFGVLLVLYLIKSKNLLQL